MDETALIIEVPESELLVGRLRSEHDEIASRGVPAHITVLYPFVPFTELTDTVVSTLRSLASEVNKFSFELTEWGSFESALWLRPMPEEPFRELTHKIVARFPEFPPYGGEHASVQPHLTVAQFDKLESENSRWLQIIESTQQSLPISCNASELAVYVNSASGKWKRQLTLPFADIKSTAD